MSSFEPTKEQQAILAHPPSEHARVFAGPGTGKSATLVALIDQLLAGESEPRIKLLTFTRAATGELAKKVSAHPKAASERPSTVHSFAISVLLRNPGVGEFPEPLRIADQWETQNIIRPTLAKRIGVQQKKLANLFIELAANWESLVPEESSRVDPQDRARFMGGWREHRDILGYTLLAELPYALRCALLEHPDLEGVAYDMLIVDEYQDLNACDLELLSEIAGRGCSIIGAGDDDQSIYSFRRAAPEGIRRFPQDYLGCADYSLSVTHRCGSRIIDWASWVIEGDPDRPRNKPRLKPAEDSPPGEVALLAFPGGTSEAKGVAHLIQGLIENEKLDPSDVLVLLRSDYHGAFSRPIKEALENLGISYSDPEIITEMLAGKANRQLLATLKILVNRSDSLAWATLLKLCRGVGSRFFEYIYDLTRSSRQQFGEALLDKNEKGFPDGPSGSTKRAMEVTSRILAEIDRTSLPEEESTAWGQWIAEQVANGALPAPTDSLQELFFTMDEMIETDHGLGHYLGQIEPLAKDQAQTQSEGVRIMTMAASKGLTVEATIIAGVEQGLIPRLDGDQAEERRLLYVAMTRARKFLFATWARRRKGPTARAGRANVMERRNLSFFLNGGSTQTTDGERFVKQRWMKR